jgi:hypothetical protein
MFTAHPCSAGRNGVPPWLWGSHKCIGTAAKLQLRFHGIPPASCGCRSCGCRLPCQVLMLVGGVGSSLTRV